MISQDELRELIGLIEAQAATIATLTTRVDNIQNAFVELQDEHDEAIRLLVNIEALVIELPVTYVRKAEFEQHQIIAWEKFEHIGGIVSEITGMQKADIGNPTRFGMRVDKIEAENNGFKRDLIGILGRVADGLVEVQGQIMDPIGKKKALDHIREEIMRRRRSLN